MSNWASSTAFTLPQHPIIRLALPRQLLFNAMVCWYGFLLYLEKHGQEVERFSFLYFSLVLPILLWTAFNAHHAICRRYDVLIAPLMFYLLTVSSISLARLDFATAYNTILFTLPIIVIVRQRLRVSLRLLNGLFLAFLVAASISYNIGASDFGVLPGQTKVGSQPDLVWRISLFPLVPPSAFFSLLVGLANLLHNRGLGRSLMCTISAYFLILSGNRTSVIAAVMILGVLLLTRRIEFRKRPFYVTLFVLLAVGFVLLVSLDAILLAVAIDNPAVANYVFRTSGPPDPEQLARTMYRGWLWQQHLTIFLDSPILGVGTFYLPDLLKEQLLEGSQDTGSESLLTGLLARIGLMVVPLLLFFARICGRAMEWRDRLAYCVCLALFITSLGYASFLVPYNFIFLVTIAMLNGVESDG